MKKVLLVLAIIAGSITTVSSVSSANADGCSPSDPCNSYAVVNSAGVVTGVLVCQPSVCGPNGAWAGKTPGDTPCPNCILALQVPATPQGQNNGAIVDPIGNKAPVIYDANKQTFSQQGTITSNASNQIVETTKTAVVVDNTNIQVNSSSVSFTPNKIDENNKPVVSNNINSFIVSNEQTVVLSDRTTNKQPVAIVTNQSETFQANVTAQQVTKTLAEKNNAPITVSEVVTEAALNLTVRPWMNWVVRKISQLMFLI